QDRTRVRCQRITIMSTRINIHRDHVRPLVEVLLIFRRKFMLVSHRPAVQITDPCENECRLDCCGDGLCIECDARYRLDENKLKDLNSHSVKSIASQLSTIGSGPVSKFSCCRHWWGNGRRIAGRDSLLPGDAMKN